MNSHCSCGGKMHPSVNSRLSFTWECEKCGKTITQKKRLKVSSLDTSDDSALARWVLATMPPELCVGCKHFEIDFGYVGEDGDPGGMGSLDCSENQFETDYSPTEVRFHKIIRIAQTCDKFEARAVS